MAAIFGEKGKNDRQSTSYVFTIVKACLFIGVCYLIFYNVANYKVEKNCNSEARKYAKEFDDYLIGNMDDFENISKNVETYIKDELDTEALLAYITEETDTHKNDSDSDCVGVYGYFGGNYLDGTGWVPGSDYDVTLRPWYKKAMEGDGETKIVDAYEDAQTHNMMMAVTKKLSDGESILVMDFSLDSFVDMANKINDKDRSISTMIVDSAKNKVAISGEKNDYVVSAEIYRLSAAVCDRLDNGENSFYHNKTQDGKYYICPAKIQGDWYVVSIFDEDDRFGIISAINKIFLYILIAMFISLSVLYITRENSKHGTY